MHVALLAREAHEVAAVCGGGGLRRFRFEVGLAQSQAFFPPFAGFALDLAIARANEPQDGVNHEEGEHAGQQQVHKEPDIVKPGTQLAIVRVGVGLILHEAQVGAGMAAAAGGDQVGLVDGRSRIGGGPHVVGAVAIPAAGSFNVAAERAQLRVEGVAVGGELVLVAVAADRRGLHAEGRFRGLQDGVGSVAIGADRSVEVAAGDGFAVHALLVVGFDFGVAGAAGFGNVGFVGRALRVGVAEDVVRAVAALAVGCDQQAFLAEREAVNRIHVERVDVGQAVLLGEIGASVACAAGLGNVERVDVRSRVVFGKDVVGDAVATGAGVV